MNKTSSPMVIKQITRTIIAKVKPSPFFVSALNFGIFWVVSSLYQRLSGASDIVVTAETTAEELMAMTAKASEQVTAVALLLMLLLQLMLLVIDFGFRSYCLWTSRLVDTGGAAALMDGFSNVFRVLALRIIRILATGIGLALFLIPGVLAHYIFSMSEFFLIDHPDWSPIRCMKESFIAMRGHKMELFRLRLSLILCYLISLLPGGSMLSKPFLHINEAVFFNELICFSGNTESSVSD